MASQRFNLRNPAVKRILQARCLGHVTALPPKVLRGLLSRVHLAVVQEMKELQASGSQEFAASVLEVWVSARLCTLTCSSCTRLTGLCLLAGQPV